MNSRSTTSPSTPPAEAQGHSPLPWETENERGEPVRVINGTGNVAAAWGPKGRANAALIVERVNGHAAGLRF